MGVTHRDEELSGERRWMVLVAVSVGITAATYLVFARWLGAPLPLGILGSS